MPTMSEGGRSGGGSNRTYVEIEPGLRVTFVLKWLGGTKSFTTIEGLREWQRVEMIRETARRLKNFTEYEITRVETFVLERRFGGGIPTEVYRPEKVDGALPEG